MKWFNNLGVRAKLMSLAAFYAAGLALFGLAAISTLNKVKVNGPIYGELVQGKDLLADILPPPEYIIESYLTTHAIADHQPGPELDELAKKLESLQKDFETRHEFWKSQLDSSELSTTLLKDAYAPAIEFYALANSELLPAVRAGDNDKARAIVDEKLFPIYLTHRAAIDKTVQLANEHTAQVEKVAAETTSQRSWIMICIGVSSLTLVTAFGYVLSRSIGNIVGAVAKSMDAATRLDFSQRIETSVGGDLGRMTNALNSMLQSLADAQVQAADYEGQIRAIGKSQAVIEFTVDGVIVSANDNFLNCVGYSSSEIVGQHHRMFCEPAYAQSSEYRAFWESLARGEYHAAEFKRIGKGGRIVWIRASYNPILDLSGKPVKVVKYATDITEEKLAADRAQARAHKVSGFQEAEVEKLSTVLSAVAEGNLTKTYAVAAADEDTTELGNTFSKIAGAVNAMCEKLRGVFGSLTTNAVQLASTSTELSATATQLAGGADQTTTQSATVAAAAEEMSTNMTNMAASTEQMTANVKAVSTAVEELTASISEIAKTAGQTSSIAGTAAQLADSSNLTISQLGVAADEIGKVIEVIQDIAEQTNLLALNATIEAARAGEAGKGFAVVATEVKELAKQTANATQDIRSRIESIQASTTEAVRSIKEVGDAIQKVNTASSTIAAAVEEQSITTKEIASNVHQTAIAASTVSTGVAESATACAEITRNMTGVDQAAKQTAQGATQTQVVGSELSHLSEQLRGMVSQFQV